MPSARSTAARRSRLPQGISAISRGGAAVAARAAAADGGGRRVGPHVRRLGGLHLPAGLQTATRSSSRPSTDGVTWSAPTRVPGTGFDSFVPGIAADPARPGRIALVTYVRNSSSACAVTKCTFGVSVTSSRRRRRSLDEAAAPRRCRAALHVDWRSQAATSSATTSARRSPAAGSFPFSRSRRGRPPAGSFVSTCSPHLCPKRP